MGQPVVIAFPQTATGNRLKLLETRELHLLQATETVGFENDLTCAADVCKERLSNGLKTSCFRDRFSFVLDCLISDERDTVSQKRVSAFMDMLQEDNAFVDCPDGKLLRLIECSPADLERFSIKNTSAIYAKEQYSREMPITLVLYPMGFRLALYTAQQAMADAVISLARRYDIPLTPGDPGRRLGRFLQYDILPGANESRYPPDSISFLENDRFWTGIPR